MGSTSSSSKNSDQKMPNDDDHKKVLERKLMLAKETPEPVYDLSECHLKQVPSGVFIMCKVLLKDSLLLQTNRLTTLDGGGSLGDLNLLQVLNLNDNRLRKLPDQICALTQLRELLLARNQLEKLPATIGRLRKLTILDVAHNRLTCIQPIACMPELRVLNVSGNPKLQRLPNELSTCDGLIDLVLDAEMFQYPPADVLATGTKNILKFLSTGEFTLPLPIMACEDEPDSRRKLEAFMANERREIALTAKISEKHIKENALLALEREAHEKNYALEAEMHQKQKMKQQELTKFLLNQQTETDFMVSKLHESRETERSQLIANILVAEQKNTVLVNNLLKLKCGPDPVILELERQEQEMILDRLRIKENDFRKQEILDAMSELLRQETHTIQTYQSQKDNSSRSIIAAETHTNELLTFVYQNYDRNRNAVVEKITGDEELQKSAVSRLIELNDARSWALVEQLRIVEQQLAALTNFEIERKKLSIDEQTNTLAAQRIELTYVLLDLLEQQDQRKKQLFTTLQRMEDQNDDNRQDFWLLQYQKLIDSQPLEVTQQSAAIDPILGHHILINGVIHTLPFFSKLWLTHQSDLKSVTDADLMAAGLTHQRDRVGILRAIEDYLREAAAPSAPPALSQPTTSNSESASAPSPTDSTMANPGNIVNAYTECVVCMDTECQIIFLPCGHMCCCEQCQVSIGECPMCRGVIENKIKVIRG